jgi:hypothetical protein
VIAVGAVLLILGIALSVASWVAVLRLGPRPLGNDEQWELARRRGFLISYPAALLIGAGIIALYLSGGLNFLPKM